MIGAEFMLGQAALYRKLAADTVDTELKAALVALALTYERVALQLASSDPRSQA
jgi:hypothetical protein